jgi:hypothetical protein
MQVTLESWSLARLLMVLALERTARGWEDSPPGSEATDTPGPVGVQEEECLDNQVTRGRPEGV